MAARAWGGPYLSLRQRRIGAALGLTGVIHLVILIVFAVSTTSTIVATRDAISAFHVTLVQNPLPKKTTTKPMATSVSTKIAAPRPTPPHPVPATVIASPLPVVEAPAAAPVTGADIDARARKALQGLAACHSFGVAPTDKERRACDARLGRLADNAPSIEAPPPPRQPDQELKLGSCRMNLRRLLSARVKCKF